MLFFVSRIDGPASVSPKLRSCCLDNHPKWTKGHLVGYITIGLSGLGVWEGVMVGRWNACGSDR